MGGRYWINGADLGLLLVLKEEEQRKKIIDKIIDKQFIGNRKDLKELLKK